MAAEAPLSFDEWRIAYETHVARPVRLTDSTLEGPCPLCGGEDRFHISRGQRAEVVAGCRRCGASFQDFLQSLFPERSPSRQTEAPPPAPEWGCTIADLAARTGLTPDQLRSYGLEDCMHFAEGEHRRAVKVPYPVPDDQPITCTKFRVRKHGADKYRHAKGSVNALYGEQWLSAARERGGLVIVEGESDSWCLWSHGIPAVGIPGVSALGVLQAHHLEDIPKIWVVAEQDEAGSTWPERVQERVRALGSSAAVLRLDLPAKDVAALHRDDPGRFTARLGHAMRHARGLHPSKLDRRRIMTAKEVMAVEYPPVRWAVPGVIPCGISLIWAAPKVGKSLMALDAAAAVATGGMFCGMTAAPRGSALMIDTEQVFGPILQDRLALHGGRELGHALVIADEWPRMDAGGYEELDWWLQDHPECRLVSIDVWTNVQPMGSPSLNAYASEYMALNRLQRLFMSRNCSLLLIHHDRKDKDGSITESASGSKAMTGVPNALLWLRREIAQPEGSLTITGRVVYETQLDAYLDPRTQLWQLSSPGMPR